MPSPNAGLATTGLPNWECRTVAQKKPGGTGVECLGGVCSSFLPFPEDVMLLRQKLLDSVFTQPLPVELDLKVAL